MVAAEGHVVQTGASLKATGTLVADPGNGGAALRSVMCCLVAVFYICCRLIGVCTSLHWLARVLHQLALIRMGFDPCCLADMCPWGQNLRLPTFTEGKSFKQGVAK